MLALLAGARALVAQEFTPPEPTSSGGVRLGLFGLGARLGADFKGQNQAVASVTLDVADVFTDRLRLRPSVEIGIGSGPDTYLASLELLYRFTRDSERAVPYIGVGAGVWGHQDCATIGNDCPAVWPLFALGFELRLNDRLNWMLEYHAEDGLNRNRLLIGLTTRRGS